MFSSAKPSRMDGVSFHLAGGTAGALFVLILLGCMNFAIGNRNWESRDSVLDQEGEIHLSPGAERDIYYPVPYANIPNLELTEDFHRDGVFDIVDQKEDHFRVRSKTWFQIDMHWHARGVQVWNMPPAAPQVLTQTSSSASPELPAEPVRAQ
jgi:hypothetical protein